MPMYTSKPITKYNCVTIKPDCDFSDAIALQKSIRYQVLKYGTKFQQALKPSNLLKALKCHTKIIY